MPKDTKIWVCAMPLEELEHEYQSLREQDSTPRQNKCILMKD